MNDDPISSPDLTSDTNGSQPVEQPEPAQRDLSFEEWFNQPTPDYVVEAAAAFHAELDELLEHVKAHPEERWVAYRGGQRVKIGTNDLALYRELAALYPDKRYCVYGIDGPLRNPDDTVV